MKYFLHIFFYILCVSFHFNLYAGSAGDKISIYAYENSLADIFDNITKQTGLRFSYSSDLIDEDKKISINVDRKRVEEVLFLILPPQITYKQRGNYIILSRTGEKPAVKSLSVTGIPQKKKENIKKNESDNLLVNSEFYEKLEKIPFSGNGISMKDCHSTVNIKNEEKMKQYLAALVIATASLTNQIIIAQESQGIDPNYSIGTESVQNPPIDAHKGGIFTFVYPMGTDWVSSINNSYNFSFNLLGGITGQTNGFEIGSVFNMNRFSASGVQIAGVFNLTGFDPRYQVNSNNVQLAGMFNFNKTGNSTQLAGGVNIADKSGVQLSGELNIAKESIFQLTGAVNVVKEGKVQISGAANIAKSSTCQISGAVNVTGKGRFQLGVVNVRDTADGVSIGVINIIKRGGVIEFGVEGGEFIHTSATFRSGANYLYSILSVGYNYSKEFYAVGAGLGSSISLSQRFGLNLELMHYNLYNEPWGYGNYIGLVQFRPVVNLQIAKHFKIFAGPTANLLMQSKYNSLSAYVIAPYKDMFIEEGRYRDFWIGFVGGFKF